MSCLVDGCSVPLSTSRASTGIACRTDLPGLLKRWLSRRSEVDRPEMRLQERPEAPLRLVEMRLDGIDGDSHDRCDLAVLEVFPNAHGHALAHLFRQLTEARAKDLQL